LQTMHHLCRKILNKVDYSATPELEPEHRRGLAAVEIEPLGGHVGLRARKRGTRTQENV